VTNRLQNVLRILERGAADRHRPENGGKKPSGSVGVHRIVDVGPRKAKREASSPPDREPVVESETRRERSSALVLYAPYGQALSVPEGRVVGSESIPLPTAPDGRLVMLRAPESVQAKSFRLLAHRLRHSGDPRVVLVTSPRAGEGKTTCAANLALALAEDGSRRVLLLEANVRSPVIADLFAVAEPIGLARQMARLETALVPWTTWELAGTRLSVLPSERGAGVAPTRGIFASALSDFSRVFDHIVVDAPSALDSADANALVDSVDGVVLAARARQTRARELTRAASQLAPARMLGVVLLDAKEGRAR
jgi:Mrp family chromosome partitioning ATPase